MAFPQHYEVLSDKNGLISVVTDAGRTEVFAGGAKQTSARYHKLWDKALTYTNPNVPTDNIIHVLMLGLAGGWSTTFYTYSLSACGCERRRI